MSNGKPVFGRGSKIEQTQQEHQKRMMGIEVDQSPKQALIARAESLEMKARGYRDDAETHAKIASAAEQRAECCEQAAMQSRKAAENL